MKEKKNLLESFTDYTTALLIKKALEGTLKIVWECFSNSLLDKIPADFFLDCNQETKADNFINTFSPELKNMSENQDDFAIDAQVKFTSQLIHEYDEIYKEAYEKKPSNNDTDNEPFEELPSEIDNQQAYQILKEEAKKLKEEIDDLNYNVESPIININSEYFSDRAQEYFLSCNDGQQKEMIKNNYKKIESVLYGAKNILGDFSKRKKLEKIDQKMQLLKPKLKVVVWSQLLSRSLNY